MPGDEPGEVKGPNVLVIDGGVVDIPASRSFVIRRSAGMAMVVLADRMLAAGDPCFWQCGSGSGSERDGEELVSDPVLARNIVKRLVPTTPNDSSVWLSGTGECDASSEGDLDREPGNKFLRPDDEGIFRASERSDGGGDGEDALDDGGTEAFFEGCGNTIPCIRMDSITSISPLGP